MLERHNITANRRVSPLFEFIPLLPLFGDGGIEGNQREWRTASPMECKRCALLRQLYTHCLGLSPSWQYNFPCNKYEFIDRVTVHLPVVSRSPCFRLRQADHFTNQQRPVYFAGAGVFMHRSPYTLNVIKTTSFTFIVCAHHVCARAIACKVGRYVTVYKK